jgi:tubulin polyglutamylase TTLL6/13
LKNDCARYKKEGKKKFFIVKPEGASQGKGIHLIKSWEEIENVDEAKCVVQKYLKKPLLIDGLKFDLRLYVLVTSMDPLRVFLHNEGFIRFCTNK